MQLEQIVTTLQLAIGPVIVISGAGLVMLSMTNRFGRVIDRSRSLAESKHNISMSKTHSVENQLMILMRRARLLRMAIALAALSILLAAFLVISLFLIELANIEATSLIIALFICCMGSLIVSLLFFIADVNVSLSALKLEMGGEPTG
ncbi:MAG: hypothetical protein ACI8ZB_004700 [Desulforhopalus sp.]|jgi:hypothetical protein